MNRIRKDKDKRAVVEMGQERKSIKDGKGNIKLKNAGERVESGEERRE